MPWTGALSGRLFIVYWCFMWFQAISSQALLKTNAKVPSRDLHLLPLQITFNLWAMPPAQKRSTSRKNMVKNMSQTKLGVATSEFQGLTVVNAIMNHGCFVPPISGKSLEVVYGVRFTLHNSRTRHLPVLFTSSSASWKGWSGRLSSLCSFHISLIRVQKPNRTNKRI